MSLLVDIVKELRGMFLADARLSAAVIVLVGVVAACLERGLIGPLTAGAGLLAGCIAIIAAVTALEARRG